MCFDSTATASTVPPFVSSVTTPLTVDCLELRKASRSVFNGSWKKPSYTTSTHLRATSGLKRFCCLLSTASSSARCAASSEIRPGASKMMRPLRPMVVAGVEAAAHAVRREQRIELRQQLVAGELLAVQRHRLAVLEAELHAQRRRRPLGARLAPAARTLARGFPLVDLAAGHGDAEQVLVDGVGLLLGAHAEAALLQELLLVGARLGVLLLDLADRRHDLVVTQRLHREVEAHLVVAHAGT